jgi:phosphotransferase system HPr-like phosphotransfer protein
MEVKHFRSIRLDNMEQIKNFNAVVLKYKYDIDIVYSRYVVNAKSLLALFSLDLPGVVTMVVYEYGNREEVMELMEALKDFIID